MRIPTNIRYFVSAIFLLLYLSDQCSARVNMVTMTQKPPTEISINQNQALESLEKTVTFDVLKQTSTIVAAVQEEASDATAERRRSTVSEFSFNAHLDTRNESSNHCEKARLCSLNKDHRPHRCSCHSYCHLFGDCCQDSVTATVSKIAGVLPRTGYLCYLSNSPIVKAVNIITSCPDHYEDEAVLKACSQSQLLRDHDTNLDSLRAPVTDASSGLTYGNVYCAVCRDANLQTSESWLWNFYCNIDTTAKENNPTTSESPLQSPNLSTLEENRISPTNFLRTLCKSSFVPPRKFSEPFTECDPTEIYTCPSSFDPEHELVALCHSSSLLRVYYNQVAYRNVHCLACNHAEDKEMAWSCLPQRNSTRYRTTFSIVLSSSTGVRHTNERFSDSTMKADDLYSHFLNCLARQRRLVECTGVCPSSLNYEEIKCRALNATLLSSLGDKLENTYSACNYWLLTLNHMLTVDFNATVALCYSCAFETFENYTVVNGSFAVYVNGTSRFYRSVLTYVKEGPLGVFRMERPIPTVNPLESDGTDCHAETLHWGLPLTTLLFSQCCMVAYVVLYIASERLRNFLGEMVLNQAIAFFWGFTFFTLRWITDYTTKECRPLVILVHFFYTAAFMWTSLFAIEVARTLSPMVNTALQHRVMRRRVAYYVVGWGLPLVLVLIGITTDELNLEFAIGHGTWQCWFGGGNGALLIGTAPMGICQTIDVIVYIYMIVRLTVLERQTRMVRETRCEKLLLSIKLLLSCGLVWAFCLAAFITGIEWLNCAFKVVTSLQGTFILLIFGLKRNVLSSLMCCRSRPVNPVNLQSATNMCVLSSREQSGDGLVPAAS